MELKYNEQYKNYSLDLKTVGQNETIDFTFKFDEPKTGEGKYGMWYLFNVTLHTDEGDKDCSFFSAGYSPVDFVKMGDWLSEFKKGDRLKLKMTWVDNNGKIQKTWQVVEDSGAIPESSNHNLSAEQKPTRVADKPIKEIVEMLIEVSKDEKKEEKWLQQTLFTNGVTDFGKIQECIAVYNEAWK